MSLHRSCVMILTTHLFLCVSRPPPRPLMGKVSVDGSYQRCKSKEPQHEVVPVWRFERDNEAAGGRTFKLKRPFEETCPHLEHECSLGPGDAKRRRACNWHPQLKWANGGRLPLVPFGDFRQELGQVRRYAPLVRAPGRTSRTWQGGVFEFCIL